MKQKRKLNGWLGWLGLVTYVAAYDTYAIKRDHETMSQACWDTKTYGRCAVGAAVVIVTKHLLFPNFLPQTDPIGIAGMIIRKL